MTKGIGNDPTGASRIITQTDLIKAQNELIKAETSEIEHHSHNFERWFGAAAAPSGETHIADEMDGVILPFRLTSGNSAFGSWVQVLGSADTPFQSGKTKFDLHRALVINTDSTSVFAIQIITGESAGFAAKLAAKDYDTFPYISASNNNDSGISKIIDKRCDAVEKVWMRCANVGGNGKVFDFYFGLHEYDV